MKAKILIGVAVLALSSTSAQAQDLSGFRIEGRLGWERNEADISTPNLEEDEDVVGDEFVVASEDDSEVAYGFELGYDAQVGKKLVIGGYAGLDLGGSEFCSEVFEDDLACLDSERTFTLGARVGVPIGKASLIYAKGGYSNGKFGASYDVDVTDNDDDEPGEILELSDTRDGYHLGAGAELGIAKGVYAKLEYVYTDFGSKGLVPEEEGFNLGERIGLDRHQVMAGVGLRF